LQELTDIQREVITLKFISGLSNKEIAELLGKTDEAVRQLQCRALKSLKIILKNQKYYE
jgi:RNA polymerase sigma-70 factor (ECF subfamily)